MIGCGSILARNNKPQAARLVIHRWWITQLLLEAVGFMLHLFIHKGRQDWISELKAVWAASEWKHTEGSSLVSALLAPSGCAQMDIFSCVDGISGKTSIQKNGYF